MDQDVTITTQGSDGPFEEGREYREWELMGMAMVGTIPADWEELLFSLSLSYDYQILRAMGMDHEEAFHTAVGMCEPGSKELQ